MTISTQPGDTARKNIINSIDFLKDKDVVMVSYGTIDYIERRIARANMAIRVMADILHKITSLRDYMNVPEYPIESFDNDYIRNNLYLGIIELSDVIGDHSRRLGILKKDLVEEDLRETLLYTEDQ